MGAVRASRKTVWVLILRRNASERRAMALGLFADFQLRFGRRMKVKSQIFPRHRNQHPVEVALCREQSSHPLPLRLFPLIRNIRVTVPVGVEPFRVERFLVLGDPPDMGRAGFLVIDQPVIRRALGPVAQVFMDPGIDEGHHEGQKDQGSDDLRGLATTKGTKDTKREVRWNWQEDGGRKMAHNSPLRRAVDKNLPEGPPLRRPRLPIIINQ